MKKIRIGTRGSRLALKQAELVQKAIRRADPQADTELVILHTKGDKILDKPLAQIGDKGLFVSEFEQALLEDRIDLAVHSAKDLPMRLAEGLMIAAVLPRADVRDVLVVKKGGRMPERLLCSAETAQACGEKGQESARTGSDSDAREEDDDDARTESSNGAREEDINDSRIERPFVLGTGSRRRQLQAEAFWSGISCSLIRGNVESRLKKLEEGKYDGILLAKAGLDRLGINGQTDQRFEFHALCPEEFLPAACQGIIAVEAKEHTEHEELLLRISDEGAWLDFVTEREVLSQLCADCSEAAAAWSRQREKRLLLDVMYGEKRASLCGAANGEEALRLAAKAAALVKAEKN